MDIENDNIRYDIPVPFVAEFDNDSRYFKKNKPHASLNPVSVEIPRRDFSFIKELKEKE